MTEQEYEDLFDAARKDGDWMEMQRLTRLYVFQGWLRGLAELAAWPWRLLLGSASRTGARRHP